MSASAVLGGIALRLAATSFFMLRTLFVRLGSAEAPVGQIVAHRSAWALVPIALYLAFAVLPAPVGLAGTVVIVGAAALVTLGERVSPPLRRTRTVT